MVRFRTFPCRDVLRVICQTSLDDKTPLTLPTPSIIRSGSQQRNDALPPLENQVPESIIRANPRKPLFAKNGLNNPYLNYHAKYVKALKARRMKKKAAAGSQQGALRFPVAIQFGDLTSRPRRPSSRLVERLGLRRAARLIQLLQLLTTDAE